MIKRNFNIPLFVPHKGCPFTCSFCNQKSITGQTEDITREKTINIIECHLKTLPKEGEIEIAFFGGSFTGINEDVQEMLLKTAYTYIEDKRVSGIRISTRPDYINNKILENLLKYKVTTIELGVQSMDENVLLQNKRGHSSKDVITSSKLIKEYGFTLGLQMMTGLYSSSYKSDMYTASEIASLLPHIARIYPTIVLKNTLLYDKYLSGEYIPDSLEEAVEKCKDIYVLFEKNKIKVIRTGLQATDNINEKNIAAGPYHSAFGELVKSRIIRDEIEEKITGFTCKNLTVLANKTHVSKILGNNKCNQLYFKEKYSVNLTVKETGETDSYFFLS